MTYPFPLSPRAKKCSGGYIDICPAHEDRDPSLSIRVTADGLLLLKCFAGCHFEDILRAAGITHMFKGEPNIPRARLDKIIRDENALNLRKITRARKIWSETVDVDNTLSQTYLNSRGLKFWGLSIRHHNHLFYSPTSEYRPALVAAITRDGIITGIQRIYLDDEGRKLDKMMLGDCKGGAVHLGGAGNTLIVSEGIENGLAFAQFEDGQMGEYWAALSTSGLKSLKLPEARSKLIVAADGDDAGFNAAFALINRAATEGWNAQLISAPQGKDWNDELLEALGHEN